MDVRKGKEGINKGTDGRVSLSLSMTRERLLVVMTVVVVLVTVVVVSGVDGGGDGSEWW